MLDRFLGDFKESTGSIMRLTAIAFAVAIMMFLTTCFLCAAAFVAVLEHYGALYACLAGAAVFFAATLLAAIAYALQKRPNKKRKPLEKSTASAPSPKSMIQTAMADPMIMAAGLSVVRTIGLKRLIPLLAIGGVALGVMASRRGSASGAADEAAEAAE